MQCLIPLHGIINAAASPSSNAPQRAAWISLCWCNCHATHDVSIVPANLDYLIIVEATTLSGLLEDGLVTFSLQLVVDKALLLEGGGYHFVFHCCIHHTMHCTGIKPTVPVLPDDWYASLHPQTHMTATSAPPTA